MPFSGGYCHQGHSQPPEEAAADAADAVRFRPGGGVESRPETVCSNVAIYIYVYI